MSKILGSMGLGALATFCLFLFMAALVSNDELKWVPPEETPQVFITQTPDELKPNQMVRPKLTPPPPKMPERIQNEVIDEAAALTTPGINLGKIEIKNDSMASAPATFVSDGDARPIVRVNPKYPVTAARDGIEGWVQLQFDINEIGEVVNIEILDAEPKRIFNKAARQALRRWKYKAKYVDGKAILQQGLTVLLDFNLNQNG
ncbi:TonB family protein [Thalassotalea euphylliae]|uniref:TonB family protein n=1 Tax=Thalassotalea euphylliae TaxID=1655234 RepID=UPI00363517D0